MEAGSGSTEVSVVGADPVGGTTVLSLPEGASMMIGEDGEQYVTIAQDGQTYAIPLTEYQTMQPGGTITIQAQSINPDDLINNPPQIVVQATEPLTSTTVGLPQENLCTIPKPMPSTSSPIAVTPPNIKWGGGTPIQRGESLKPFSFQNPGSTLEPRRYKPIKVDNWGIFLLSRLQTYFQKKEYTDLTLRFPEKNAQIKVHKLVINACTDYFVKQEENGLITDGVYDMPSCFLPELVAPIIRFMYTGRLDLKSQMFTRLRETANILGMAVLTKLLDAQINAPVALETHNHSISNSNRKQKVKKELDPVRQMKSIKKIEKKFERELKQEKLKPKDSPVTTAETNRIVQGKKLPIWKKRETQVNTELNELDIKHEVLTPKAYGKAANNKENGRQLKEIQENANFEKIRQSTNNKDTAENDTIHNTNDDHIYDDDDDYYDNDAGLDYDEAFEEGDDEDMIHEHLDVAPALSSSTPMTTVKLSPTKTIMKSAEKETPLPKKSVRFSLRPGGSTITPASQQQVTIKAESSNEIITSDIVNQSDIGLEDVSNVDDIADVPVSIPIAANEPIEMTPVSSMSAVAAIKSPPKKRKPDSDAVDKAVEEFSKAAEQEERELESSTTPSTPNKELLNLTKMTRRGRPIHPPNLESPSESPIKLKKPKVKKSPEPDHSGVIAELMRKNPDLFKGNKPVKIKVMTKDADGKSVVKVITVKAQPHLPEKSIDMTPKPTVQQFVAKKSIPISVSPSAISSPVVQAVQNTSITSFADGSISLRNTPKVKYTGKRGRPPIIKPGERDPHAKERQQIENNLKTSSFTKIVVQGDKSTEESFAAFDQVSDKLVAITEVDAPIPSTTSQLDPSSEAEALSHVASGIAASLGLPVGSPSNVNHSDFKSDNLTDNVSANESGPLSDLEHFDDSFVRENRGIKRARGEVSGNTPSPSVSSPPKKLSKLALEWTEDEEDETV